MHIFAGIAGGCFLILVLVDAFQTVILPRRPTGHLRLTRLFYAVSWTPWAWLSRFIGSPRQRESWLSFYGPLSLVLLIVLWACFLILGFALLFNAQGSPFTDAQIPHTAHFYTDLYVSGTTLFTLGLGDVVPLTRSVRIMLVVEAGMGLGFVALMIGYFPVLYGAFSRREVNISLLDARAGSPPSAAELMRRHASPSGVQALDGLLSEWERWAAELLESHISYPLLCYFRSQHTNQSWLSALCAVLDTCALLMATIKDLPGRQAQLTFAMARHAVVDLSQVFDLEPITPKADRLTPTEFTELHDLLCQAGTSVSRDGESLQRLNKIRELYEPYVETLSRHLNMALPPFLAATPSRNNWQTVAALRRETQEAADRESIDFVLEEDRDHHMF